LKPFNTGKDDLKQGRTNLSHKVARANKFIFFTLAPNYSSILSLELTSRHPSAVNYLDPGVLENLWTPDLRIDQST